MELAYKALQTFPSKRNFLSGKIPLTNLIRSVHSDENEQKLTFSASMADKIPQTFTVDDLVRIPNQIVDCHSQY